MPYVWLMCKFVQKYIAWMHHIIKLKIHLNEKKIRLNNSLSVSGFQYGRVWKYKINVKKQVLSAYWMKADTVNLTLTVKKSALAYCNDTFFISSLRFLRFHALLRSFFLFDPMLRSFFFLRFDFLTHNYRLNHWNWLQFWLRFVALNRF